MRKLSFIIYAWGSVILYSLLVLWLATVTDFQINQESSTDFTIKILYKFFMYMIFVVLLFRAIIITLKNTVDRLAKWRSKSEKFEDYEFVLIIETLIVIIVSLVLTLFAIIEEWVQSIYLIEETYQVEDVLVSILSILLTTILVYALPVIGELEYAIKHRIQDHKR